MLKQIVHEVSPASLFVTLSREVVMMTPMRAKAKVGIHMVMPNGLGHESGPTASWMEVVDGTDGKSRWRGRAFGGEEVIEG